MRQLYIIPRAYLRVYSYKRTNCILLSYADLRLGLGYLEPSDMDL